MSAAPMPEGWPDARFTHHEIRSVAILVNPVAGRGRSGTGAAVEVAEVAVARFRERGIHVGVLVGDTPEESRTLARHALRDPAVDALVVCGGDGMISLAVGEQAFSGTPLGIIPAGTGNDLAREYGIPLGDPVAAADVVIDGRTERVDLGRATTDAGESSIFASVLCAGLDSAVNRRVNAMRLLRGRLRYLIASVLVYPRYRPRRFRLTFDDGEVLEREVLLSAYAITRSYGGSMRIAPEADRADGLFDVCVVSPMPTVSGLWNLRRVYSGTHTSLPAFSMRRARTVRIEAAGVDAFADGDLVAPLPVTVEVLPGAGLFLVPTGNI